MAIEALGMDRVKDFYSQELMNKFRFLFLLNSLSFFYMFPYFLTPHLMCVYLELDDIANPR